MQVCTLLQTDNHASTPTLSFLQAGCPSCRPANSVKALKATDRTTVTYLFLFFSASLWHSYMMFTLPVPAAMLMLALQ